MATSTPTSTQDATAVEESWRVFKPPPQLFVTPDFTSPELRYVQRIFKRYARVVRHVARREITLPGNLTTKQTDLLARFEEDMTRLADSLAKPAAASRDRATAGENVPRLRGSRAALVRGLAPVLISDALLLEEDANRSGRRNVTATLVQGSGPVLTPGALLFEGSAEATRSGRRIITAKETGKPVGQVSSLVQHSSGLKKKVLHWKTSFRAWAREAAKQKLGLAECSICFDIVWPAMTAPLACSHRYCRACIGRLIRTAMADESMWPPRCCNQAVPRSLIQRRLSPGQFRAYVDKEAEYSTAIQERWYCTRPRCERWFRPGSTGPVVCPHCTQKICRACRAPEHDPNMGCIQDANLAALENIARLEGWRHCPRCNMLIELRSGCLHLTCRCGHGFCYVCLRRWRTCSCTETQKNWLLQQYRERRIARRQREAQAAAATRLREREMRRERERARKAAIRLRLEIVSAELDELHEMQCRHIMNARQVEEESCQALTEWLTEQEACLMVASLIGVEMGIRGWSQEIMDAQKNLRERREALAQRSRVEDGWMQLAAKVRAQLLKGMQRYMTWGRAVLGRPQSLRELELLMMEKTP